MRRAVLALALGVCLLTKPPALSADEEGDDLEQIPSCGQITIDTAVWRYPNDLCRSVQSYGNRTAIGKHWLINFGHYIWSGYSKGPTPVVPKPADEPPPSEDPLPMHGSGCPTCNSPLMLDRHGEGFHLTSAANGVLFDLDGDGMLDWIAWTRGESEVALLAYDRNGNGRIDDGTELFGNNTPTHAGQRTLKAENGFEALRFSQGRDYGVSEVNGLINSRDSVFRRLLLWTDRNHNGISEPGELQPAAAAGLVSIGLTYDETKRRDEFGNEFRLRGSSQWLTAKGKIRGAPVWDVWLQGTK